jgi:hypothetical protein
LQNRGPVFYDVGTPSRQARIAKPQLRLTAGAQRTRWILQQ